MGYEKRGIDPGPNASAFSGSNTMSENDVHFTEYVYNDVTATLLFGEPVYKSFLDAAEFNATNTKYSLANTGLSPAATRTGGTVLCGSTVGVGTAGLEICVGIYQPENFGEVPQKGQVIRVLDRGVGVISAQSPAAGSAGVVGGNLIASVAVNDAVPGARASGVNIGSLCATRTFLTIGTQIFAAASAVRTLCNAFIMLS